MTVEATSKSDLPPILNATEIYEVLPFSYSATDQSDVDAIMDIKQTYNINKDDWQGDPCLPENYKWSSLGCSLDSSTPRIISLNMSASKLTGDLRHSLICRQWSYLTCQTMNFRDRNLSGNKLTGPIPKALRDKFHGGSLDLSLTGNPDLCQMDPCPHESKKRHLVVLVVAATVGSVLIVIFLIVFCIIKGEDNKIVRITGNFRTIIGEGGFGKVYLGTLTDNTPVPVKLLSQSSRQGYKEFQAEAQLLIIVHHRNLVSLIGYCDEGGSLALIYEYMENGNLSQHLSGLEYLHNGCKPSIIHRDLKPANILLTGSMEAKIADFGLSKIFITENAYHITTCPNGTRGYLDPEFHKSGNLNNKSDVYSVGIILFELITGQPAIIRRLGRRTHILEWLSPIVEKGDIRNITDPRLLQGEFDVNAAWKLVEIAMSSTQPTSMQRPAMGLVLTELKECMAIETASNNLLEMSLLNSDPDMAPVAR
ncbi:hypothetical protein PTKIN_Ptkin18bG0065800 [Pterospermum kingtungense]